MEAELRKIRERDFSDIDDRLYENLERTDSLTSALSHLSDFQRFLMEQIDTLQISSAPTATRNPLARSIAKNFDNLRTSLVRCSKVQTVPVRRESSKVKAVGTLMDQMGSLKDDLMKIREITRNESEKSLTEIQKAYEKDITTLWALVESEQQQRQAVDEKVKQAYKTIQLLEQKT